LGVGHNPCFAIAPSVGLRTAPSLSLRLKYAPLSTADGVGNKPDAVADVRGTKGSRWKTVPFRIVPALDQVPKNVSEVGKSNEP